MSTKTPFNTHMPTHRHKHLLIGVIGDHKLLCNSSLWNNVAFKTPHVSKPNLTPNVLTHTHSSCRAELKAKDSVCLY